MTIARKWRNRHNHMPDARARANYVLTVELLSEPVLVFLWEDGSRGALTSLRTDMDKGKVADCTIPERWRKIGWQISWSRKHQLSICCHTTACFAWLSTTLWHRTRTAYAAKQRKKDNREHESWLNFLLVVATVMDHDGLRDPTHTNIIREGSTKCSSGSSGYA